MSDFKVHTIHEQVIIPANHKSDGTVKYHVCYGEVLIGRKKKTKTCNIYSSEL